MFDVGKPTEIQQFRVAGRLRLKRLQHGHGQNYRRRAKHFRAFALKIRENRFHVFRRFRVNFVQQKDDFSPPFDADDLQKFPFAVGQRAIRRDDENHEIGFRHEIQRQFVVPAHDRIRAGRVHDIDVFE